MGAGGIIDTLKNPVSSGEQQLPDADRVLLWMLPILNRKSLEIPIRFA
jgi:hypothetical protein